jgi:hypothetical protein
VVRLPPISSKLFGRNVYPITRRRKNKMHFKTHKDAYIFGIKEGMLIGMDKGMEIASMWCQESSDCPPANTAPMIETTVEN